MTDQIATSTPISTPIPEPAVASKAAAPSVAPPGVQPASADAPSGSIAEAPALAPSTPADASAEQPPPETGPSLLGTPAQTPFDAANLKMPEGFGFDETGSKEFAELVGDLKVGQEHAQKLLDFGAKFVKAEAERSSSVWRETNDKWREEMQSDPEIGGDKLDGKVRPAISKVLDSYPNGREVRQMLDYTGTGNHPVMAKFLYWIAQQINEGGPVVGTPTSSGPQKRGLEGAAQRFYPKHFETRQ